MFRQGGAEPELVRGGRQEGAGPAGAAAAALERAASTFDDEPP